MAPRKPPRIRTSVPSTSAASPSSAANEVYRINELRSRILRLLDPDDLARCMRVEKKGMYEVAKELYREISYGMGTTMKRSTARQRMYAAAVNKISIKYTSSITLPAPLKRQLTALDVSEIGGDSRAPGYYGLVEKYLYNYHGEAFKLIVEPLRKGFPNLRTITSNTRGEASYAAWTVRFAPAIGPLTGMQSVAGHIEIIRTETDSLGKIPSTASIRTPPPSTEYTLAERFDLTLEPERPISRESALLILREGWAFGRLHRQIDFGTLPVSLADIADLCDRQIVSGYHERLEDICGLNILPWHVQDFRRLASVASGSLTCLQLSNDPDDDPSRTQSASFADLPEIIAAIRSDLPNLVTLHLALSGGTTAESICKDHLAATCLEEGGTIRHLQISQSGLTGRAFSVIRMLSTICTSVATVHLTRSEEYWGYAGDSDALHHLRMQPAERRVHLSTVDFATLDVSTYSDLYHLSYDNDGRPRRLGASHAARWVDKAEESDIDLAATTLLLPGLSTETKDLVKLSSHLQSIATDAAAEKMLEEAERAHRAALSLAAKTEEVGNQFRRLARSNRATADEMGDYVESLKRIVGGRA